MSDKRCWLCGSTGGYGFNRLELHHIFSGNPNRKKSEKYGLVVWLCGETCHRNGPQAVHRNAENMRKLRQWGQRKAMQEQGWTIEDFIREFGRNYLEMDDDSDKI